MRHLPPWILQYRHELYVLPLRFRLVFARSRVGNDMSVVRGGDVLICSRQHAVHGAVSSWDVQQHAREQWHRMSPLRPGHISTRRWAVKLPSLSSRYIHKRKWERVHRSVYPLPARDRGRPLGPHLCCIL